SDAREQAVRIWMHQHCEKADEDEPQPALRWMSKNTMTSAREAAVSKRDDADEEGAGANRRAQRLSAGDVQERGQRSLADRKPLEESGRPPALVVEPGLLRFVTLVEVRREGNGRRIHVGGRSGTIHGVRPAGRHACSRAG